MFFFRSKKLIVSQGESRYYQSIGQAIHDASPNTTILVRRGNYQESIIIDKPLTIIGDGLRGDIVITGTDKNCITLQTHLSKVTNLTIRHPFSYGNAVYIPQGELMLEDCEIVSDWVGVFIQGQKTNPTLRQCKINGGLCFGTETQGIIEGCDITANNHPGVTIGENANPKISGCKIHDCIKDGIRLTHKALGLIEDCDIFANAHSCIYIENRANPTVRRCKVHDGQSSGIWVTNKAQGAIEECDIFANAYRGIYINNESNPIIRKCKIFDGKSNGIYVTDNGQGTIEECDIFANAYRGIYIGKGGNPIIRKCKIFDGKTSGISVTDNGGGTIEECEVSANAAPGIYIDNRANPIIRKCKIFDGKSNGIYVTYNGQGTIEECDIFANAYPGIYIGKGGNPIIRKCKIFDGKTSGICVKDNGGGTIEECEVSANAAPGIYIDNGANPIIRKCKIFDGKNNGISVTDNGQGTRNNTISEKNSSEKNKKEFKQELKQQTSNKTVRSHNSRLELLQDQLESMIGLNSVKEAVLEIVDTEIANQRFKKEGYEVEESETRHMLFSGNPGTGKTTIARLIGEIFKELGILRKGEFIEVQRDSLVAIYLGQTASKTTELVESALDSVLFIDEAYSLANGKRDEYGREAINTLIALMENYRHRLVVIFAGYSEEMKKFLNSNPGLKSRIAFHIDFPDYTGEEMHSIFLTMCNNTKPGWICPENVSERLKSIFINMYENREYNFANGRDVRNIFEKMLRRIRTRIVRENLSGKSMRTFSLNDIPPDIQ